MPTAKRTRCKSKYLLSSATKCALSALIITSRRWQREEERPSVTPIGFLLPLPRQAELDRLLLLSFRSNTRSSWQLQHGRALTFLLERDLRAGKEAYCHVW